MRLHPPLAGPLVITQEFAARPEVYAKFNLPGHEGLDLRAATGTPVMAVDDGTVALVSTTGAYGLHYRLVHAWGESVYAHLSKQFVTQGQRVKRGQVIGLSGSTGNSDGPHLHFGLRVAPFFRDSKRDKWQGFCNGKRYFEPERFLIGPHIHFGGTDSMIPLLRRWQPPVTTVLDPDVNFVRNLKAASPNTKIVGRIYRPDSEVSDRIQANPGGAAQWMDDLVRSHPAFADGHVDWWQVVNEVCQGPEWEPFKRLDACMNAWMDLAEGAYHCGLFSFGVGNPDTPGNDPNWWNLITPTLRRAPKGGHVLLIHEYGYNPGLDGPLDNGQPTTLWRSQRYVNQVRPLLQVRDLRVIVAEFGSDGRLVNRNSGWQDSGMTADQYADAIIEKGEKYGLYRDQIVGVCVYTWQPEGKKDEWRTYDIDGRVCERLAVRAEEMRRGWGDEGMEPPAPTDGSVATAGWTAANKQRRLAMNPGAALQKAMVKDGFSPVTDEFTFAHAGGSYVAQVGERVDKADRARLFYCPVGAWADVRQAVES